MTQATHTAPVQPSGAAASGAAAPVPSVPGASVLATPPTVGGRVSATMAGLRRALAGTPGRMRVLTLLAVVSALAFGLLAGQAFRAADGALGRAGDNTTQLVRIQAIHTNLMRADADATNAFLVGGLEPAERRADYTAAMGRATTLIAEAARAQPADGNALAALNQAVMDYTGLIEQARANNRQGLPVGAQYLKNASDGLGANAVPLLEALVTANEERATAEFDGSAAPRWWLAAIGLVALAVLVGGLVWLARRTHRFVNVPMAAAATAILLMTVAGFAALSVVNSRVSEARDGPFSATLSTARARIAAFDAKSNESLTLIARGSGAAYENAWKGSSATVTEQSAAAQTQSDSARSLAAGWTPYVDTHKKVRAADDGGDWDGAVRIATGTGANTANAAFGAYDTQSGRVLATVTKDATDALSAPRGWLPLVGILGLLVGLLAAIGAWWGVSLRLEEYR